jgi:membrane protease YdiL (CAAX protease family)
MDLLRHTLWFLICWLAGFLLASLVLQLLAPMFGINDFAYLLEKIKAGEYLEHITTLKIIQMLGHLSVYTVPPLLFANFLMRTKATSYLYLNTRFKLVNIPLILALFILAYPIAMWLYYINMQIIPAAWIANDTLEVEMRMMEMKNPMDLILNILMLGVVAGVGEELLFRGVIQRLSMHYFKNIHTAIWMTALLFSLIHFQPEGFFPRFLLGALLGYVFLWTGSLWASILGHVTFNASQVVLFYMLVDINEVADPSKMPDFPIVFSVLSVLIFMIIIWGLVRLNKNRGLDLTKYMVLPEAAKLPF